jgi:hypothetical protein
MNVTRADHQSVKEIGIKTELSNIEIIGTKAVIKQLPLTELGLAYTQSGIYAALFTSDGCSYKEHEITAFTLLNNNTLIMICSDDDGNEVFYILSNY